ncbi:MAG: hypothetical protein QXL35_04435 [Candidatus Bathyarchaeia archaeon]
MYLVRPSTASQEFHGAKELRGEPLGVVKEFDADIHDWGSRRGSRPLADGGKGEALRNRVRGTHPLELAYEELDYNPRSCAERSGILEGGYEYVAWICIALKEDITNLAQRFLEWGEGVPRERYGERGKEVGGEVRGPSPIPQRPDPASPLPRVSMN